VVVQRCIGYLVLVLLTAATAHAGILDYRFVFPEKFRLKISLDLRPYWDGILDVNEVIIDMKGEAQIRDLSLADRGGRNCLTIKYAELDFVKDQNDFKFLELRIKQPRVILWYDNGELAFPLNVNAFEVTQEPPPAYLQFEQIKVEDASLTMADDETYTTFAGFQASAHCIENTWNYVFGVSCKTTQSNIDVNGFTNIQNNKATFNVRANHTLTSKEGEVLLSVLEVPVIHDANGRITARLHFEGSFDNENILWPVGEMMFRNATLHTTRGLLMDNFESRIVFPAQQLVLFQNIRADSLGGRFAGAAFVESDPNKTDYGGHFVIKDANLEQFSQVLGRYSSFTKGRGRATYDFTGTAEKPEDYSGRGIVFLDNADIWKMPVIPALFSFLQLGVESPLSYSDAIAAFNVAGPVITIERANIASSLTAIEVMPGSTINYETQYIDAHAVFVPLKKLRKIIIRIPILNLFADIYDQLAGVSIKGYWSQPANQLIRKEPIKDIGKVPIKFFKSAEKSEGQISSEMYTEMENYFGMGSMDENQNKK
jgi:hypothetical protein